MSRKKTVEVLGVSVKVRHVDLSKEKLLGDFCNLKLTIRLEKTMTESEYKRVLAHETFHARLHISGLVELITEEVEEALCVLEESKKCMPWE